MARWFGFSLAEIRAMSLEDFHRLDGFLTRHPPVDILVAAYLGYKDPSAGKKKVTSREAIKMNSEALAMMPPRQKSKMLAQMPAAVRTPEMLAVIEAMRAQCQTS